MSAPTDAEAVRWLDGFTAEYLTFRATQISAQSDILIKGDEKQINDLQSQARTLRKQVDTLANEGPASADKLTEAVTKLSQINDKIGTLQGEIDDETLRNQAVVLASRVIDPAASTSTGVRRRTVGPCFMSHGGSDRLRPGRAAGDFSDRLRLRIEVASGLNASVLLSVRKIAPLPVSCGSSAGCLG
jgi:hypothetical protein